MLRGIWITPDLRSVRLSPHLLLFAEAICLVLLTTGIASAADPFEKCKDLLPFGKPELTVDAHTTPVCHDGYIALHDDDNLVPRWVAYTLTAKHTFGCNERSNKFHPDPALPEDRRATPADYADTGFDQGHQAPAQDFAWDKDLGFDSFSMLNMAPQKPELNRQGWKRLEELVRVWASDRSKLLIYVGPVLLKRNKPRTIGRHKVTVPQNFWKVIVDPEKKEAIAFVMPQAKVTAAQVEKWITSVADAERVAGVKLALPEGIDRNEAPDLWPAKLAAWKTKKKALCKGGRGK